MKTQIQEHLNMALESRYRERLQNIPAPGTGCHPALLAIANLGVINKIPPERIHADIRQAIPVGKRKVSDREIQDAVSKALSDKRANVYYLPPKPKPVLKDGKTVLDRIIEQSTISDEADLWEASPIRLLHSPKYDAVIFLKTLFRPDDLVWIGERHDQGTVGKTIRTVEQWIAFFQNGGKAGPHIILNPLTGTPAPIKSGDKETFRGDGNISTYRYCLAEFDTISREDQIKFWSAAKLPIVALIDSGRKSVHAWLKVDIETAEQWQNQIKNKLYDQFLTPMGVDGACSNPSRLSRLPGCFRTEKQAYQRLLWLSSTGRSVAK